MDWEELNKLTYAELKKVATPLIRQANQRARRLEAKAQKSGGEFYSPELNVFKKRGRPFTTRTKGKNKVNQLRKELRSVSLFLKAKTSTIKGSKEFQKMVQESTGLTDKDEIAHFWNTIHKLNSTPQFREWLSKNGYRYDDPNVKKMVVDKLRFNDEDFKNLVNYFENVNNVTDDYDVNDDLDEDNLDDLEDYFNM